MKPSCDRTKAKKGRLLAGHFNQSCRYRFMYVLEKYERNYIWFRCWEVLNLDINKDSCNPDGDPKLGQWFCSFDLYML